MNKLTSGKGASLSAVFKVEPIAVLPVVKLNANQTGKGRAHFGAL